MHSHTFWSPQTPKPTFAHLSSLVIRNRPWPTCLAWNRSKAAAFCATPPVLGTPRAGNGMHPATTHRTPLPHRWNRIWDINGSRWRHLYCCDSALIFRYQQVDTCAGICEEIWGVNGWYANELLALFRVSFEMLSLTHWMVHVIRIFGPSDQICHWNPSQDQWT